MWIAVALSHELTSLPVRVSYWGIPVVIFRTRHGALGALEDRCPHRHTPLSGGRVDGETLRCGYHHYGFNTRGHCVDIPEAHAVGGRPQAAASVRRFYTRDAQGLVWISIDDSPFPIPVSELSHRFHTGAFDITGDLRVWMDHFLDATHCLWTHRGTVFGNQQATPRLASIAIQIGEHSRYPVVPAVEISYVNDDAPTVESLMAWAPATAVVFAVRRLVRTLRTGRLPRRKLRREYHHRIQAHLLTPLCQQTVTNIGPYSYSAITAICPGADGRHRFFYSGYLMQAPRGRLQRRYAAYLLHRLTRHHLGQEDNALLSRTVFSATADMALNARDGTVVAMRQMFARYLAAHAHLYPDSSCIHTLGYGDGVPSGVSFNHAAAAPS